MNALVPETWPEELGTEFGEVEVSNLCDFFHILFSQVKQEYRDFNMPRSYGGYFLPQRGFFDAIL